MKTPHTNFKQHCDDYITKFKSKLKCSGCYHPPIAIMLLLLIRSVFSSSKSVVS